MELAPRRPDAKGTACEGDGGDGVWGGAWLVGGWGGGSLVFRLSIRLFLGRGREEMGGGEGTIETKKGVSE